ncbi:MAG: helix-turn-helix transcriptional regulator [Phycisphaerales bacterium]|nr:helix-turn-helix transcriptional regulator [Phycisphaerales bacterium]
MGTALTESTNGFAAHQPPHRTQRIHDSWARVANAAGCCVFLVTREGVYRTGAKTTAAALNIGVDSMVGKSVNDLFPPEIAAAFREGINDALDADARGESEPRRHYMVLFGRVWSILMHATDDWVAPGRIVIVAASPSAEPIDLAFLVSEARRARDRKLTLGNIAVLSEAEIEVFALVGAGIRDVDVAKALSRSVRTVNGNVRRIMQKLGFERRTQMVKLANEIGMVAKVPA